MNDTPPDVDAAFTAITDTELRVQVFLRTYRDDYAPAERDRIVAYIRQQD